MAYTSDRGIGGSDGPELVGVISNGREEVHRDDESRLVVQPIDGGVVSGLRSHQQVGMRQQRNVAQDLTQVLKAQLGRSTRTVRKLSEADGSFELRHVVCPLSNQTAGVDNPLQLVLGPP